MLSKDDFRSHIAQMREFEVRMNKFYAKLEQEVDDQKLRQAFGRLKADEARHDAVLAQLQDI